MYLNLKIHFYTVVLSKNSKRVGSNPGQVTFFLNNRSNYLPAAIPVTSRPTYNRVISSAKAIHNHPARNGTLLICKDLFLPKYSASNPDRIDPIGFVTAPKLAAKKIPIVRKSNHQGSTRQ